MKYPRRKAHIGGWQVAQAYLLNLLQYLGEMIETVAFSWWQQGLYQARLR
jgi:hypothetical protein